jgi:predicted AlkP superfamily pyrophosphatase or phosphodiesterase
MNHIFELTYPRTLGQVVAVLLFVTMICGPTASAQDLPRTPKAIFVIVDGIPADVVERANTPNLDEIAGENGYARAYVGGEIAGPSESPTISAVGYNSLITGTWANKHNVYDNDVKNPNYQYWDIFRIAKAYDPSLRTAIFSTWLENRTRLVGDGLEEAGGLKLDYHFDGFELDTERFPHDTSRSYIRSIDELVSNEAARYILEEAPDLSWVYLEFTDDIGHDFGDSPQQLAAVSIMDGNVGKIWSAVRRREASYNEDWLMIVTTDHGRDADTGKEHGGQTGRERTTWIVTNSKRLNERFANMPAIVDILPSIVTHLGLGMPPAISAQLDGKSFID